MGIALWVAGPRRCCASLSFTDEAGRRASGGRTIHLSLGRISGGGVSSTRKGKIAVKRSERLAIGMWAWVLSGLVCAGGCAGKAADFFKTDRYRFLGPEKVIRPPASSMTVPGRCASRIVRRSSCLSRSLRSAAPLCRAIWTAAFRSRWSNGLTM